jgi:hypothetical protein
LSGGGSGTSPSRPAIMASLPYKVVLYRLIFNSPRNLNGLSYTEKYTQGFTKLPWLLWRVHLLVAILAGFRIHLCVVLLVLVRRFLRWLLKWTEKIQKEQGREARFN